MSQSNTITSNNSYHTCATTSFSNTFNYADPTTNFYISNVSTRAEILRWLSPLKPPIRHDDIRAHRVEHVGDWLLRTEEYQNWLGGTRGGKSDHSALFCYGDPGVGKTYISSLVIDTLCDIAKGQNASAGFFYLDFAARKEQSPTTILSSLLRQVVSGLKTIPTKIVQAFQDQTTAIGGRRLRLGEIVEMLQDISSLRAIYICIDALDECMAEYQVELLDSLRQILDKSPGVRVFLAGRLHIRDQVEKHLARKVVAISITPTNDDIIRFLRAKLKEDTTPDAMNMSLEEDILTSIPETVSEIFLLVSLNIKAILQETTLHRRREKLATIRSGLGLGDAYDATIGRIKAQQGAGARLGMAALMWISHSERPLNVDEICHALAVMIGSTDINTNNISSIQTVLGCCQGLAAVDKESSTIRLIHFTLKKYLSGHTDLFNRAHSTIAEICLTYLNFQAIKDPSANPSRDLQGTPFLEYSSSYWGTHMRIELSDRPRHLALDLLDQYENHISAELLWKSAIKQSFCSPSPFSALHCISYFGIAEVTTDLIRTKKWDVNQRDSAGLTPLMWAARYGREEVVNLLLQQKHAEPDRRDTEYGRTALSWAAGSGHEGVVRIFLDLLNVNPGSVGHRWGKTSKVIGQLFRRKYANPDQRDDQCDDGGQTPLSLAAESGHDGVVRLLLAREDVGPDRPNNYGQTPLSLAAWNGYDKVVKLLLAREDVSPDKPDDDGQTPLSLATRNGHDAVVGLLLGREEVSPDRPDNRGNTPLSLAARYRHKGIVKLLRAQQAASPSMA